MNRISGVEHLSRVWERIGRRPADALAQSSTRTKTISSYIPWVELGVATVMGVTALVGGRLISNYSAIKASERPLVCSDGRQIFSQYEDCGFRLSVEPSSIRAGDDLKISWSGLTSPFPEQKLRIYSPHRANKSDYEITINAANCRALPGAEPKSPESSGFCNLPTSPFMSGGEHIVVMTSKDGSEEGVISKTTLKVR